MNGWLAGAAIVPFPVPVGSPMAGYAARTGPSTGTYDELTIGAVVLGHGERRLALVAVDLAAVDAELPEEVAVAAGLARSEVVLCPSHTHSGPIGPVGHLHPADPGLLDVAMRADFVAACAGVVRTATERREPVALVTGSSAASGVAANRNDPAGPADDRVTVLAARRSDGTLLGCIVHFACHPTILGAENRLVSADFPGALRRALTPRLDPGAVVLYANGAAGDVSTRFTRQGQDVAEVERTGAGVAAATERALADARPLTGPISYRRERVSLPSRTREELDAATTVDPTSIDAELSPAERRRVETRVQGAAMLARLAKTDPRAVAGHLDLEAWSLGGLTLIAVPGELFASLGAGMVAAATMPVIVLGYANGYVGYLADTAAYVAGTYEALASPFPAGTGEYVAAAAVSLLSEE